MTKSRKAQANASGAASSTEQFIPLNFLKKSPHNARRTPHPAEHIESLAASIAAHGMLQAPVVEPEIEDGKPTGCFLVTIGEGRRQAQLLRVKRKEIAKDAPIRCRVETDHDAFEISLAENEIRASMHPADQFEAFHHLHTEQGQSVEDIAARFGVTPAVVRQRLKLAVISPRLIRAYRENELTLDQLTAFAITDDHARQEAVFDALAPFDDRRDILAALNEDHVNATDPRAAFVGREAYLEAGGTILADLFDQESGGFFADASLLTDLVNKKLAEAAEAVRAEGWKWVEVLPRFDYSATENCRRIYARDRDLSDEEQQQMEALEEQYEALDIDSETGEGEAEAERIEAAIEALKGEAAFDPEELARAGAIVTLSHNGTLSVQRGYVRPEDDLTRTRPAKDKAVAELPEKLLAELTASKTSLLRNALAQNADVALCALLHSLVAQAFYGPGCHVSCIDIRFSSKPLERFAPGIGESATEQEIAKRYELWAQRLPKDEGDLWDVLEKLGARERLELLAHCTSLAFDAVRQSKQTDVADVSGIVTALGFDMAAHWTPTAANYLGRVSKARILDAVREGVSPEAAENLADLKKEALAAAAAERLAGKGWLPEPLRVAA